MITTLFKQSRAVVASAILTTFVSFPIMSSSQAGLINFSDAPLDTTRGVKPNVLLTFDDSGSMSWAYMPDAIWLEDGEVRVASSAYNPMYYNPAVVYTPVDNDGDGVADNASFTAAWENGFVPTGCADTFDLSYNYRASWDYGNNCDANNDWLEYQNNAPAAASVTVPGTAPSPTVTLPHSGIAAYYYVFDNTNASCDGTTGDNDCYDPVVLDGSTTTFPRASTRTDCVASTTTCSLAEERQNFANWYSFYRKRLHLAKAAAGRAFSNPELDGAFRISRQGFNFDTTIPNFADFTGANATNFFNWLYSRPETFSGTPLLNALNRAGQEFQTSGINSPYAESPGTTGTTEHTCQQNFHILLTDGYWNGGTPGGFEDDDSEAATFPADATYGITSYSAQAPFDDSANNSGTTTAADIAFFYWATDLRGDLTNNVPIYLDKSEANVDLDSDGDVDNDDRFWNPRNDPANWQHMVTFTMGMGVDGNLTYNETTYQSLLTGATDWPSVGTGPGRIDDLWHAAVNSRGRYFSAGDPNSLITAFGAVLEAVTDRVGSATAVASTGSRFEAATLVLQPLYNTDNWFGDLVAFRATDLNTALSPTAQTTLQTQSYDTGREIITINPSTNTGIPFRHASLTAAQQALVTNNVVNYVRGDASNEVKNGGSLRNRTFVLGDIVNSEPDYVGPPSRLFPDSLETKPYSTFASTYSNRKAIAYVGANDGMLHGFDVTYDPDPDNNPATPPPALPSTYFTEVLAYVPSKVYDNLTEYTSTSYAHKFYVDGTPVERDAFFSNNWHTVLVGGLNAGGQAIYALDITDPTQFDETNASSLVMWEFTDQHDPDLGYTYSQPEVAKMNNGKWMAVFGNGYNNTYDDATSGYCTDSNPTTYCSVSQTGDAVLYIVDLAAGPSGGLGTSFFKLSTENGTAEDPTGTSSPNGLSSVVTVDVDRNFTVDFIYGGDLFGNLWKFDVRDSDPTKWTVYKTASGTPTPLFVATDDLGNRQPITSVPVVGRHTSQSGYLINFGTGKYLEPNDRTDVSLQSFYGIWDRDETKITTFGRSHTFNQRIIFESTTQFSNFNARVTSDDSFDFYTGNGLPPGGSGEFLGWRMDLEEPDATDTTSFSYQRIGERSVFKPQRRGNRIIFTTIIPSGSSDPCAGDGESWLMEVNATTGQRLQISPFDYDENNLFDEDDFVIVGFDVNGDGIVDDKDRLPGTGIQDKTNPRGSRAMILVDENGDEVKITSSTTGALTDVAEPGDDQGVGRRSWIQLIP